MKGKRHILVVDDHACVLEGLKSVLQDDRYDVEVAESLEKALMSALSGNHIDLMVVDMTMKSGDDGLCFAVDMKKRGLIPAFILFTMHDELWNISVIEEARPDGVVFKGDDLTELREAVETVSGGGEFRSASYMSKLAMASGNKSLLTAVDREVLKRIGDGESSKEIAERMSVSTKSVEYHRASILRKLSVRTIPEAVRKAVSLGIMTIAGIVAGCGVSQAETPRPEAVDLGLSVFWADRNLGAAAPEEAGDFYCYGETAVKERYNWSTYIHCDGEIGTAHDIGTDNIAGTELDAAHVVLGDGWRLPTAEEVEELLALCGSSPVEIGESVCRVFSGAQGEIVLPLAGYMNEARLVYQNVNGVYMTANNEFESETWSEPYGIEVWNDLSPICLMMTQQDILPPSIGSAHLGYSVRPVRDREQSGINEVEATSAHGGVVIYDINGRRVQGENLTPGIYFRLNADNTTSKFIVR